MESNQAALAFWMKAIRDFAGEAVVPVRMIEHGEPRHLFRFDVPYACTK